MGDFMGPVVLGAAWPGGRLPEAGERFGKQEDTGRPLAFVFIIDPFRMLLGRRNWHPRFADELHRLLVHAHDRLGRVVGFFVGLQHLFHTGDELAIGVGRDYPVLDFPLGHAVFFSVCRTVSGLIDSTISSSTICSASSRSVQWPKPAGGLPKRRAINFASAAPSSNFGVGGV